MGDYVLSTAWEEYGRAINVSRPWVDCWQKTKDPRHLSLADACQEIAQQWLKIAQQERQISRSTFKRESEKLTAISELELA